MTSVDRNNAIKLIHGSKYSLLVRTILSTLLLLTRTQSMLKLLCLLILNFCIHICAQITNWIKCLKRTINISRSFPCFFCSCECKKWMDKILLSDSEQKFLKLTGPPAQYKHDSLNTIHLLESIYKIFQCNILL